MRENNSSPGMTVIFINIGYKMTIDRYFAGLMRNSDRCILFFLF